MAGERPRIKKVIAEPALTDATSFTSNKCSEKAKQVFLQEETLKLDIWFDRHYHNREQQGDDNGKRDGIDNETVLKLVSQSFKHLLHYTFKIKDFRFIHYTNDMVGRVGLQLNDDHAKTLNVIVEYHFLELNNYEATVITAMREDGFHFKDGQYILELLDKHSSILYRKQLKKIVEISNYYK